MTDRPYFESRGTITFQQLQDSYGVVIREIIHEIFRDIVLAAKKEGDPDPSDIITVTIRLEPNPFKDLEVEG